jgi:hypothetical protein
MSWGHTNPDWSFLTKMYTPPPPPYGLRVLRDRPDGDGPDGELPAGECGDGDAPPGGAGAGGGVRRRRPTEDFPIANGTSPVDEDGDAGSDHASSRRRNSRGVSSRSKP